MKQALAKIVGSQKLTFEELAPALSHVEATLNCRPITILDSLPDDGIPVLSPAHFLNGCSLTAIPTALLDSAALKHWNHVKRLRIELQERWYHEDLRLHQKQSKKWKKQSPNLQIGDVVGVVRGVLLGHQQVPFAVVTNTCPGSDGLVCIVELYDRCRYVKKAVQRQVLLLPKDEEKDSQDHDIASCPPEDVRA